MWVRTTMGSRRELFKSNYFIHVVGNINSIKHFIFIIFNYHYILVAGKVEMIVARQYPLFLKNKRRSVVSQVSGSPLRTRVTCASAPSYRAAWRTMWRGTKPTWQRSIPPVTQIAVIAVSSFPSTIN